MLGKKFVFFVGVAIWASFTAPTISAASDEFTSRLSFEQAINLAQQRDPLMQKLHYQGAALGHQSIAAATLADPKLSLSMANLPTDSFEFNQEPMTQFKVGYSQMFPQGDSLRLKQQQLQELSEQFPYLQQDRKAKVAVSVGNLWLESFKAKRSIQLIEDNRALFEKLAEIAQANYASALGKTRQQDIIRAQLELTRLDDRLTQLNLNYEDNLSKLFVWLTRENANSADFTSDLLPSSKIELTQQLPSIQLIDKQLFTQEFGFHKQLLIQRLNSHPAVLAVAKRIQASKTNIELQQQKYQPGWGINASYAYRNDSPLGQERADFFSLGVTFELPLFTSNRQDKQVAAAKANSSVVKTEKWNLLRLMLAEVESKLVRLKRIKQRQQLFNKKLLPQARQQAEASLVAYTSDDGDFAEVVRARIAQLNAEIEAVAIRVEKAQLILELNYFLVDPIQQSSPNAFYQEN